MRSDTPHKWRLGAGIALLVLCLTCIPSVQLFAGGLRGFPDAWLLNPRDTSYLLSGGPKNGYGAGSGKPQKGWAFWVGAGQGALYAMEDLPLLWAEIGVRQKGLPLLPDLTVSYERLGREFLVEEWGSARLLWGKNPRLGIRLRSGSWELAGEKLGSSQACDLEGHFHFSMGGLLVGNIGLFLHPVTGSYWGEVRARQTVAELKFIFPGAGAACRIDRNNDGAPGFTFEGMVRLSSRVAFGLRGDPETGSIGGSLVILVGRMRLETSHLVHPALGVTNRFMLGAGDPAASLR